VRLKLNKLLYLFCITSTLLFADALQYNYHHIHASVPKKGSLSIALGYKTLNDTVDILNLKEKEFGNSKEFDTIGDMSGYDLWTYYCISDDFMIYYKNSTTNIKYGSNDIKNISHEIYTRYNLLDTISFDIGVVKNKLYNFYITNIEDINQLGKRYIGSDKFSLTQKEDKITLKQSNSYTILEYYPWVGLEDTSDSSIYLRAIKDLEFQNFLFDYFIGIKQTKIKNKIVANSELAKLDPTILKDLSRNEKMLLLGLNLSYSYKKYFMELGYEYDRFKRDEGLDYIDINHILDISLGYKIYEKLTFYISGKLMSNQLNGQIPYLYNQYTQTTYDHKYGYASTGLIYSF